MIQVKGPDGAIVQFPDGTAPAAMQAAMGKHYGAPQSASPKAMADIAKTVKPFTDNPALLSFMNGYSANHFPQIAGAMNVLGVGLEKLTGHDPGYPMRDAYDATQQILKPALANNQTSNPIQDGGAQAVGLLANPISTMGGSYVAGAKGLLGAMGRSAAVNGLLGGYMDGKNGAVTGATIGAAVPVLGKAGGAVANRVGNVATNIAHGVQSMTSPVDHAAPATAADTARAAKQVAAMMRAKGVTPVDLVKHPAVVAGSPITTAEAIGRPGVQSLGALARRPGATGDALQAHLTERSQLAPARIQNAFASAAGIHPEAASGDIDALITKLSAQAKPLYDAALASPDPVWTPELSDLAKRPVIKKAIGTAANDLLNAGKSPTALGFKLDPDTGWTLAGRTIDPTTGGVSAMQDIGAYTEQQPTAQTWDLVKKAVGRQIERNPITGRPLPDSQSQGNYGVRIASQDLTTHLAGDPANGVAGAIPGYRAALDKAGDYLQMQDAFDRGGKLLTNPNVSARDFADVFGNLDDASQHAFKGGFANKLYEMSQNGRLNPRMFKAPGVQQKVVSVLGPDAGSQFLDSVGREADLAGTGSRMMPGNGSPTMEFANAEATHEGGQDAIGGIIGGMLSHGGAAGFIKKAANMGAEAGTTPQVRNEMGRLLMQPPQQTVAEMGPILTAPPRGATPMLSQAFVPPAIGLLGAQDQLGQ